VTVLASSPCPRTKADEPVLWTVAYGKGRVVHTPMGHDTAAMSCVGFIATMQRGTEWAATGKVTIPLPADFPSADKASLDPDGEKK
jgi:type 1 glutamine amidotransferase